MPESSAPDRGFRSLLEVEQILTHITWLVTCDWEMRCIPSGAVAIDGQDIVGVGTTNQILSIFRGRETIALPGFMVLPGLVNTHTHAAMSCFRGLGDDLPLGRWLHEVIFPAEAAIVCEEMVYWGTLLSAVEMLKNGITTFCDGYFFEEAAARAALDAGSRAVLGQGILDFPTPDQPDPARNRERAIQFLKQFPSGSGRIRPSLFCHAPYTCGPRTLQWAKALCREHGILFQIHVSETAREVEDLVRTSGETPVFILERLGLMDPWTLCAHCVWVTHEEIEILASRGAGVSHNVESNMKLASGVAPVPRMLEAGIRLGIGTDGCACNNDLDLFSEMDKAAKLHKLIQLDPVVCPAPQMLRMATCGGASITGWEHQTGSIEVGKKADLIAVDLDRPHLTPLYDPISHIVYAVKGSDVRHVWVDGRKVVWNGEMQTIDEERIMAEVQRLVRGRKRSGQRQC